MDILTETQNFWQRYQRGGAFRAYLRRRLKLIVPALMVFLAYSVVTTAASVMTLGGTRSILVLVGLLGAPVFLIGSLYVQVFVFFLWLENRAIAHATHHVPRSLKKDAAAALPALGAVVKPLSPVVQAIGGVFFLVPLAFLAALSPGLALLMIALFLAVPVGYAALDR